MEARTVPSACLEVVSGPAAGQRLPLESDIEFGRMGALSGDPWLSQSHAAVRRGDSGQFEIEDLGSIEGTTLNGSSLRTAQALHLGDVIELGSSRMVVTDTQTTAVPQAPGPPAAPAPASDSRRVLAYIVDLIIEVGVAIAALRAFAGAVTVTGTNDLYAAVAFLIAAELTYRFLFEALSGQTLGKRLCGIRVVRVDGKPLDPNAVLVRTLLLVVDLWFSIGLIVMVLTGRRRRRRIGDLAAGTIVVRAGSPHAAFARRERDRLMLASPLLWLATIAIGLKLLGPGLQECRTAGIDPPVSKEGSCLTSLAGHAVELTAVNAGHKLSLPGYDVTLERTAVRPGPSGTSIVAFEVAVTNNSGRAERFDPAGDAAELWMPSPLSVSAHLHEGAPGSFATFWRKGTVVYAGASETGWLTFSVPTEALSSITDPTSDLVFASADGKTPDLGEIRLWQVNGSPGQAAIAGLTG